MTDFVNCVTVAAAFACDKQRSWEFRWRFNLSTLQPFNAATLQRCNAATA